MEINTQSYFWWLENHNNSNCSPWLQSTLSELNEKTKAMLKLIEEDADSFAQRAEMYYKKRPELISMVEDFYRAHRSLAERYDQLKSDHAVRIRPPLRQSNSLPKSEDEYVSDSVNSEKSFDSWTEGGYSSEAAAEFEVDDPEEEADARSNQEVDEIERDFSDGESFEEVMKLKDELDRLREENEIQKNVIRKKDEEKEELVNRFLDNIGELREEIRVIREENLIVLKKTSRVSESFGEVTTRKDEMDKVKMENMYRQVKEKAEKVEETKKFEVENCELMKMEKEGLTNNGYFESAVAVNEEETEVTRQFEVTNSGLNEMRWENVNLNASLVSNYEDETEMRYLKDAIVTKDGGNCETIKLLNDGCTENDTGKEAIKLLKIELAEKNETIRRLSDSILEKDADKNESIRQLNDKLAEVDAEKNEAIMRLSDALLEKNADKNELIRQLNDKLAEVNAEKNEAIRLLEEAIIEKEEKNEAIRQLNNALEEKGEEIHELIRQMNNALEEKDEDKREVIRQLSIAMEILREESKHLKKILVNKSLSKKSSGFEIFKGINLGKIFSSSANYEASFPQM